jgi:hypothetical protein
MICIPCTARRRHRTLRSRMFPGKRKTVSSVSLKITPSSPELPALVQKESTRLT